MSPATCRAGVLLALALVACRSDGDLEEALPRRLPQNGMVVCEHPLAAEIGAKVLRRGGNAVDAGVATALALAVVYPQAGNLGGGGFALWVPGDGEPAALDFRETAPQSAHPDLYRDAQGAPEAKLLQAGALSVAVPGTPAGLWELHARHGSGRMSFQELARPAIELAREGFAVDAFLAAELADPKVRALLTRYQGASERFYPGGEALAAGDALVQSDLAQTLELYARSGPSGFYRGATAQALLAELAVVAQSDGRADLTGTVSAADLEAYRSAPRVPLHGWFRGLEVISMPPPSSGGIILLQVLAVLDGFPISAQSAARLAELRREGGAPGLADPGGLDERTLHWWIEALRRAFARRAVEHGDPDFAPVPVERLLSPRWVARTRMGIGERARPDLPALPLSEGESTTHLSVLDGQGNALSLTTTLNSTFGSGILVRGAGFLLNNEMDDFALGPDAPNQFGLVGSAANQVAGGKRPLSSMTPTVLRDGGHNVQLILGSPGGPRIITAVIGVVVRTVVFGQSLADAIAAPRFHQQWAPAATEFEPRWPAELLDGLRRRGHEVREVERRWARVQAIWIGPEGEVEGLSDPRGGGAAIAP
jgi:gamma-glutamyltranspeptidase / glutathione hydrolase